MKPAVFKLPNVPTPQIDRINRFKGINVSVDPTQLEYNESPDMLNMTLDTEGALDKRTGYAKLFATALGGTVWSAFDYHKSDGTTEHLLHAGTKLFKMPLDGSQPVEYLFKLSNALGKDGNCEDATKWSVFQVTNALDTANKVYGNNAFKLTISSTSGNIYANYLAKMDKTKYYILVADLRNGNSTSGMDLRAEIAGSVNLSSAAVTDTTRFSTRYVKISPSNLTAATAFNVSVRVVGTANQFGYVDGIRLFEISQTTYNALDTMTEQQIATMFPYFDDARPQNIMGLANQRSNMFVMGGKVYIQDGAQYLEYDGLNVVEPDPYIPTLFISTPPAGGGAAFEDFNLLGTKFKQSFSGDGTATVFQLALSVLDATPLTAVVGTTTVNEGAGLTVDRTLGKVTITPAPATGTPNNVVITASKTVAGLKAKITSCRNARLYGGTNDTRVWMWRGNILHRSDPYRPNYFMENAFQKVGGDDDIQNMVIQYDTAVIEKEFSKWSLRYEQDSTGTALFPIRPINDSVGCIAPYSSQLVENAPVSLTRNGVYTLSGGNVRDERNVSQISKRIDKLLLAEPNLKDAISIDFDQKYMIFLNGKVYVWDYRLNEWYPWDNFPATSVWEIDSRLYFGDAVGNVYYLKKKGDLSAFRDVTQPILWHWYSKENAYGLDERRKLIEKLFITIKPDVATSAGVYFISDKQVSDMLTELRLNLWSFNQLDFNHLSFLTSNFPQPAQIKVKAKKVVYFQIVLRGGNIDESLGVLSINTSFSPQSYVK